MSRYSQTVEYLFSMLPAFTRIGPAAYKADLGNITLLCEALGNPQSGLKYIHVAGTNGKGSCSHMIASILQEAGYKTGLFTSPHLKDFRERIKINGKEISEIEVVDFVENHKHLFESIKPSFFEMTVALAFLSFKKHECEVVVLETGLGGRLDSTNIIHPEISLITNISLDHTDLLGKDIHSIAYEKAGIIKSGVPVVISETGSESIDVFLKKAAQEGSVIYQSDKDIFIESWNYSKFDGRRVIEAQIQSHRQNYTIISPLSGGYQLKNLKAVIKTCEILKELNWNLSAESIEIGIRNVIANTNLRGRWEQIGENPAVFCDTGHNKAGIEEVVKQIELQNWNRLHIVFGMMRDKTAEDILALLPLQASYYFCAPDLIRALPAEELKQKGHVFGLEGMSYPTVQKALEAAKSAASPNDLIYVGGSTFVVAEVI